MRSFRAVSMTLTTIQTAQMFAGVAISVYVLKIKTDNILPCQQSMKNLMLGVVLYVTFAILFVHYFVKHYLSPSESRRKLKNQ
ncbi:unnamed protein product [Gongylonema pulchrum]|uniref:Elongation of very long chain fatty acids protein n=1 Tax=Gongylonema pulchrum TaxID=637853 RepID=A0A183DB97_9BILA|nr:unnamed protein product [Gongylonema pulchrum]